MYTFKIVNGDWDFSKNQTGEIINDQECLYQIQKNNIQTIQGTDNYCPEFGSDLEIIAGTNAPDAEVQSLIRTAVMQENQRLVNSYRQRPAVFLKSQVPISLNYVWQVGENTWDVGIQTLDGESHNTTWSF